MRKILVCSIGFCCSFVCRAQSITGVTGKRDTSYSNNTAYINTIKTHPYIKIVPEVKSKSVSEKRNISYCEFGDRKLMLDVFYPSKKQQNKRTAILIIHGGGWRTGDRSQHYALAQRLAELNYVCFTPEYRLSTEALYPAAVYDLKAALRWVHANAKEYNIDTAKIAVLGFSAGGELAAFLGVTNNNKKFEGDNCGQDQSSTVHAIIDMDGILAFIHSESGEGDDSRSKSAATHWFGYSKTENPELWKEGSPLTYVSAQTPPTLFINSSVGRMHAGREDFRKVLDQFNIYSDVKTFSDAPHSFPMFHPWFEPTLKYVDDFLKKIFKKSG